MGHLADIFDLVELDGKPPAEVLPASELAGIRAVVAGMMDSLPSLQAIICYGVGYDGIDLAAAKARGIRIANSPGSNAAAVADLAMGLLLAATRRLVVADHHVRSGNWTAGMPTPLGAAAPGMTGARIGIYGMGEIGRKIAARAAAFEAEIGYFSRSRNDLLPYSYRESLMSLAEWADVLIVAVRADHLTRHTVDAAILRALGPSGYVVNIARGSVIDQVALKTAIVEGAIAGAGLDVFETEPPAVDELVTHPNVVLAPHIGGHTAGAHDNMQACVLANLNAFFAGSEMPYPVAI